MNSFARLLDNYHRFVASDLVYSFWHSQFAVVAAFIALVIILGGVFAPWVAPQNPFDLASLDLMNAELPPAWTADGDPRFLLGTDTQGRDILSAMLYGSRISLFVGITSLAISLTIGISLGLISGYIGGILDSIIMRIADMLLSFPTILNALLINGIARGILPRDIQNHMAMFVIIFAICFTSWVRYARTVRASVMVEKIKGYTQAAQVIGLHPLKIMFSHILPNVLGPVLVIATLNFALAILIEATLSFLGVGMPPTEPSLGTLIQIGNEYLFSGIWWVVIFPSLLLVLLVLSINVLGDWLRDALNPKLR